MKGKEQQAVFSPLTRGVSLCVITDNDYCVPAIVSLTSAKKNKRRESHYRVHIIQCRVSSYYIRKFRELDAPDFEIIIHAGDIEKYKGIKAKGHVPITTMLKLDMASHLSNEGRTLYIDGDTIIKDDLTDLFYTDLEGAPIAAVRDIGGELKQKYGERIGVKKYYNAGILLPSLAPASRPFGIGAGSD
ncbi:MAG: glycosyltransferase family 8 protein [Akkermansia sp.]